MILGIGTDIVKVARMQAALDRYGERFAARILTDVEMTGFRASGKPAHFLAKRFAAKEAFVKALGTGFRDGVTLKDLSVTNTDHGQPRFEFTGPMRRLTNRFQVGESFLSLADEDDYAIAFVTLLHKPPESP